MSSVKTIKPFTLDWNKERRVGYRFLTVIEMRDGILWKFKLAAESPLSPHSDTRFALLYWVSIAVPVINQHSTIAYIVDCDQDLFFKAVYTGNGIWVAGEQLWARFAQPMRAQFARLL